MMVQMDPEDLFRIDEEPEWTLEESSGDLLQSCYAFNWEQVQETLAKLRRFRYIQPDDPRQILIKKLLPVVDGFERLFELANESGAREKEELGNWLKNFEVLYKRLLKVLSQEGVRPIESLGQPIDLDHHEVVDVHWDDNLTPGTVVKEEQKGYYFRDKVIRDAKVVVAKPKSPDDERNRPDQSGNKEGV